MTPRSAEHAAAIDWYAAGATPVPIRLDGTKAPIGTWKEHIVDRPGPEILNAFTGAEGVAVLCGSTSGQLEMLEFEGVALADGVWDTVEQAAAAEGMWDLWRRIVAGYYEASPKGGVHLFFRVVDGPAAGNQKLAERPARPDEWTDADAKNQAKGHTPKRTLIETRGQGGYVIVAPTRWEASDPAGPHGQRPWTLSWGSPATIAAITTAERDAIYRLCRRAHSMPLPPPAPDRLPIPEPGGEERPGDRFARQTSWHDILVPHGWRWLYHHGDKDYWCRPGKTDRTVSATTTDGPDGHLYVFSTSTEFDSEVPYTKFGALALLEHGGSHSAAASALGGGPHAPMPLLPAYAPPWMGEALNGPQQPSGPAGDRVHGWGAIVVPEGTNPVVAAALVKLGARLRTSAQLDDIPLPRYVVDGWLKVDEVAQLIGASGSMKSFVAIDLAAHIATGQTWHGCGVDQRTVMFVAAEGGSGIRKRVRAWEKHHHGGKPVDRLLVIDEPVQIAARLGNTLVMSPGWVALAELVHQTRTGVLFVDTQARSTVGVKENDNTEMGAVFDFIDAFRRMVRDDPRGGHELTIVLVHHTGKAGADGRGASAMYAAVNTELRVTKKERPGGFIILVTNSKNKDDAEAAAMAFYPTVVAMQPDELSADGTVRDGDEATTSVVMVKAPAYAGKAAGAPTTTTVAAENRAAILDVLDAVAVASGGTDEAVARTTIYGAVKERGRARKSAEGDVRQALAAGLLRMVERSTVVLTDEGMSHVRGSVRGSLNGLPNFPSPPSFPSVPLSASDQASLTSPNSPNIDSHHSPNSPNSPPYVVGGEGVRDGRPTINTGDRWDRDQ